MVFDLLKPWSRLLLILSVFLINHKIIMCSKLFHSMDKSSQIDSDETSLEIGINRRSEILLPKHSIDLAAFSRNQEPLDKEFRSRLEQFFSPDVIQKMTDLIIMNQKIKDLKGKQTNENQLSVGNLNQFKSESPLPFTDKDAFFEAYKKKHRKTTTVKGLIQTLSTHPATTTESHTNILLHLYHRFG